MNVSDPHIGQALLKPLPPGSRNHDCEFQYQSLKIALFVSLEDVPGQQQKVSTVIFSHHYQRSSPLISVV